MKHQSITDIERIEYDETHVYFVILLIVLKK